MNEIGLHQFSSVSNPTQSSDSNVNMNIISVMSDKGNKHINNKHDIDDTENDDVNSPFKTNHNDLVTLSPSETEIKTINRRSHGKSLFRSIFCCFSSSLHRNHAKSSSQPSKLKNSSLNSTNFNIACNTNLNNNIANDENSISVNNNNNTTINNETTDNNQVGLNLSITNGTINSINNNNLNNNTNNITNNLSSKITNTNVNTDNSNGFQSNYNFSPSYPSYKENYHQERFLLPQINTIDTGKKCLIIDLDETLVHSSFKQVTNADFIVPVEIDGLIHQVYVLKRPFVDEFLKKMGQIYECVLFTASLAKYADPVADLLDKWGVFRYRLFREACVYYRGNYVKDLSRLGRDLNKVIILDNSPASYIFHPNNAVPCISWFDDMSDTELIDLIPHFERLASVDSVYSILKQSNTNSISNILNNQSDSILHQQTTNYVHSQVNYDENLNQQVPIQTQSVIYQIQNTNTVKNNSNCSKNEDKNDTTTNNNNFNYLLDENKILLSIDLMMTTKQQQLQKNQINQDNIRIREEKKINSK